MQISRNDTRRKDTLLLYVSLLGLLLAGMSGASEHVPWLQSWCASFSDGCRETAKFTLFHFPLWYFGVGFYAVLCLAIFDVKPLKVWLIPTAIGVEITLVAIMAQMGVVCIFCLGNALVVLLLALLTINWENFWQSMALILLGLLLSTVFIGQENKVPSWLCSPCPATTGAAGAPAGTQAGTQAGAQAGAPGRPQRVTPPVTGPIAPGDSQIQGPADALLTVYVYSDFRCPACRRQHPVIDEAMKHYDGKIRWVFKNFPLPMHPDAQIAAEGALCAAAQHTFQDYQEALYAFQEPFTPESLEAIAEKLSLDPVALRECLASHASQKQVDTEISEGVAAGINALPSLVVGGVIYPGTMPMKEVQAILDQALKAASGPQ